MASKRNYHLELDGLPLIATRGGESLAAGSSTFANKVGSSGGYDEDNLFSVGLLSDFSAGVGGTLRGERMYFSTIDTRRPNAILPPRILTTRLTTHAVSTLDTRLRANRAYFVEIGDKLWMFKGQNVYRWNAPSNRFDHVETLSICVTSAVNFGGYIHVAGKRSDGLVRYVWLRPNSSAFVKGDGPDIPNDVYIFYVFGGLLYAASEDKVYYTNGDEDWNGVGKPAAPGEWEWSDPIQIGNTGNEITGMAGLIYQTLAQSYLYVSTASHLTSVIPGDAPVTITEWPISDERNGVNMTTFYNRIFTPVGNSLFAIQTNGDILDVGTDNGEGLPCGLDGAHIDIVSAANYPMALVAGDTPTVWANKTSGWHFVATLPSDDTPANGYHSSTLGRTFVAMESGRVAHWYDGDTTLDPRRDSDYRYAPMGVLDSGWYPGALYEVDKFWYSVFADADCIDEDATIEVRWTASATDICDTCQEVDYEAWHLAGYLTESDTECHLPIDNSYKRFRFALILRSKDGTKTPVVRAMGVKYIPKLINQFRWNWTVTLPDECLTGIDGQSIPGYDQVEWNSRLRAALRSSKPVKFVDVDGLSYNVLCMNFNKRVYDVQCDDDGHVSFDIDWGFTIVEV